MYRGYSSTAWKNPNGNRAQLYKEVGAMTCGRCKGLMVNEWRPDFTPETFIWRCINCGSIVDPLIELNRKGGKLATQFMMEPVETLQ